MAVADDHSGKNCMECKDIIMIHPEVSCYVVVSINDTEWRCYCRNDDVICKIQKRKKKYLLELNVLY